MYFHGTKILLQMVSHDLWAWNFWLVSTIFLRWGGQIPCVLKRFVFSLLTNNYISIIWHR